MKSAEEKLIEKVVTLLAEDATIFAKVEGRVYASHISSVESPSFPAISMYVLESKPRFECPEIVAVSFQLDAWFPAKTSTWSEVLDVSARIRSLLHRGQLTDNVIGLKSYQIYELGSGPKMFEQDTELYHFPKRYYAEVS